jgi:hypothetical protein
MGIHSIQSKLPWKSLKIFKVVAKMVAKPNAQQKSPVTGPG